MKMVIINNSLNSIESEKWKNEEIMRDFFGNMEELNMVDEIG